MTPKLENALSLEMARALMGTDATEADAERILANALIDFRALVEEENKRAGYYVRDVQRAVAS